MRQGYAVLPHLLTTSILAPGNQHDRVKRMEREVQKSMTSRRPDAQTGIIQIRPSGLGYGAVVSKLVPHVVGAGDHPSYKKEKNKQTEEV